MTSHDWETDALCAQVGGDEWFPESSQGVSEAIAICRRCPAITACLAAAMAEEAGLGPAHRHGIRGGLTRRQRAERARKTATAA
ncbi:WhiB family transcriptional regulator [Streptomyces xiamenensis]